MKYTVYYDSGTTNSRAYLLGENCELLATAKREVGSKDSALAGSNKVLILALKELYDELLSQNGLRDGDVNAIYASGMITSNVGLLEIPHLIAPASAADLHADRLGTPDGASPVGHEERQRLVRVVVLATGAALARVDVVLLHHLTPRRLALLLVWIPRPFLATVSRCGDFGFLRFMFSFRWISRSIILTAEMTHPPS